MVLTFLIGVLVGGGIIWLTLNCCCKKQCENQDECCLNTIIKTDPDKIDVKTANKYFHNYYKNPIHVDSLKGFTITMELFQAMKVILKHEEKKSVHGFTFYFGNKKEGSDPVIMIVGTGSPEKPGSIYSTPVAGSGPCPYVCDHGSQITNK